MGVTVYPKKYAHGFCFAVLCCGYTLTDFPISIGLTSLALWQSNDCPSASKATLMNMDKYFMWIHYERLHNHNKAKHNKTVCIFLGIYCISSATQLFPIDCCAHQNRGIFTGAFYWNPLVVGGFPLQRTRNVESISLHPPGLPFQHILQRGKFSPKSLQNVTEAHKHRLEWVKVMYQKKSDAEYMNITRYQTQKLSA